MKSNARKEMIANRALLARKQRPGNSGKVHFTNLDEHDSGTLGANGKQLTNAYTQNWSDLRSNPTNIEFDHSERTIAPTGQLPMPVTTSPSTSSVPIKSPSSRKDVSYHITIGQSPRHQTNGAKLSPKNNLLERSTEVADEVAALLASVRRTTSPHRLHAVEDKNELHGTQSYESAIMNSTQVETSMGEDNKAQQIETKQSTVAKIEAENITVRRNHVKNHIHTEIKEELEDTDEEQVTPVANRPLTMEDLEPTISEPLVTPACIADGSTVVLRSQETLRTLSIDRHPEESHASYKMNGYGLGQLEELLHLHIQESNMSRVNNDDPTVLCYWDRIVLKSQRYKGNVLGAIRRRHWDIGFSQQSLPGPAEQWRVIRADFKTAINVGRSATDNEVILRAKMGPTEPVQFGDPIVLRNCHTGGILSLAEPNLQTLRLTADSHDPNRIRHDAPHDATTLGKLQRHDRIVPLPAEAYHFLPPAIPAAPLWSISRLLQRKQHPFLKGNYYLQDLNRKEKNAAKSTACPKEAFHQEVLLIDELLGSFMGLEGEYVKVQGANEDISEFRCSLIDPPMLPFDKFCRHIVECMLPLSKAYMNVKHFLCTHESGYAYGCVVHAFCEELDTMIQEYVGFIANIESDYRQSMKGDQAMTLCNLQVLIKPVMDVMLVLEAATFAVRTKKGGALLNSLRDLVLQSFEGNNVAEAVLHQLLKSAAAPYLKMLSQWLECGDLSSDPHSEFMVQKMTDSRSWEYRYSIFPEHVLKDLFPSELIVERILATGRYWNALRSCTKSDLSIASQPLCYFESTATFANYVQGNYERASQALVDLLLNDFDLIGSLRLVKRFFLLDQGDFFINFLDAAEDELRKDLDTISMGRIQYWLDLFIQNVDKHADDSLTITRSARSVSQQGLALTGLHCCFASGSLADRLDELFAATGGLDTKEPWTPLRHAYGGNTSDTLTGLDAFMFDFRSIPFPISLILSEKAMDSYQLLFRHLFFAKYVERRLVGIWQDHQDMKELQSLRKALGPTFLLRQRMVHFVQNLIYYLMHEVLEPQWIEMEAFIFNDDGKKDETIDDIVNVHLRFLNQALEACLLTNRNLVRSLTKLMKTCLLFSDQMKLFMKATKISDDKYHVANEKQKVVQRTLNDRRDSRRFLVDQKTLQKTIQNSRMERRERIQRQTARVEHEINGESYPRMISRFDEVFSKNLRDFMSQLTQSDDLYHSQKVNLCIRLDYNGYVTKAMGLKK
jgi:gamma-tubulin complex component 2